MMKLERVFIDGIDVRDRHRVADPAKVQMLADSMKTNGLQQPISVWSPDDDTCDLVAGLHRLEAARLLGWEEIDCIFVDMDEVERELWEIAENLHRIDLTKEERDRQIRRYAELLEKSREVSQQNATKPKSGPKGGRPIGIPGQIARETGLSRDTVRRAIKMASTPPGIAPDVKAQVEDTAIADSGVQLRALAAAPEEKQREAVKAVCLGNAKDVRDVLGWTLQDQVSVLSKLRRWWRLADADTRAQFRPLCLQDGASVSEYRDREESIKGEQP